MNRRLAVSLIVGAVFSAAALYLSFRNIPVADVVRYFDTINYYWILPAIVIVLISFALRAVRWRIILSTTHEVDFRQAFHPLMIAFMLNCILPGRAGELARPLILKTKHHIPFFTGLATVAAERIFDFIIIIGMTVVVAATVTIDPELHLSFGPYTLNRAALIKIGTGMVKLALALFLFVVLISIRAVRHRIQTVIMAMPDLLFFAAPGFRDKFRHKVCTALVQSLENAVSVFGLMKDFKKIRDCLMLSVLIWTLSAASYYIMAQGCPGIELSFLEISAVMVIICLFIALPSVPGYWGLWEAGGIFAMSLFGVSSKNAAGFTLANHVIQIVPVILVGWISALVIGLNLRQMTANAGGNKD